MNAASQVPPAGAPAPSEPVDPKPQAQTDRVARVARLEEVLRDRYVIRRAPAAEGPLSVGHAEYRFRGAPSRIAFTESTFRLVTDTDNPSVARSMVDIAQARNWRGLRISGSEDFRRLVWLEATARGIRAVGYEPGPADREMLRRAQQADKARRIEPSRDGAGAASTPGGKPSSRGGGRRTVVAAIEAILVARGVPEAKRNAVLAAATEKLAQRASRGQVSRVRLYDGLAQPQDPASALTRDVGRTLDRAARGHAR